MIITRRAWVRSETISNGSFKCAKEEVMKEIQLEIRTQKQTRIVINVYDRESRFFLVNTFWRLKGLCNVRSVVLSRKTSNFHSNLYNFSRQQFLLSYTTHYVPRGKLLYNIHGIPIHLIINSLNTNSFWSNVLQMFYELIHFYCKSFTYILINPGNIFMFDVIMLKINLCYKETSTF